MAGSKYVDRLNSGDRKLASRLRVSPLTIAILAVLRKQKEPISAADIGALLGTSGRSVRQTISRARRSVRFRREVAIEGDHRGMWLKGNVESAE